MPKKAFTLAEILIVLGIIGLIADMTIPTLVQKVDEKITVTKVKKIYSNLSQAYTLSVVENGPPEDWATADTAGQASMEFFQALAPSLKFLKICGTQKGCFPDVVYCNPKANQICSLNIDNYEDVTKAQLQDGSGFLVQSDNPKCDGGVSEDPKLSGQICASLEVDINGFKKPNQYGVDIFSFWMTKTGIIPKGGSRDTNSFETRCLAQTSFVANHCAAWVIYNENMDYLKCDDLSWDGKKTCN